MAISTDALSSINNSPTSTGKKEATAQDVQDRFLKLLVAQLNNQDPMNPLDNAQMTSQIAQLNTVTGIENLNSTVNGVLSQMASMQALQGAAMVGHDVLTEGSSLQVTDGTGRGGFELATQADNVKVQIRSASGSVVETIDLGSKGAGRHNFSWDATGASSTEGMTFSVVPSASNTTVTATALQRSRVESVSNDNNTLTLTLAGGKSLPYASVKAIL